MWSDGGFETLVDVVARERRSNAVAVRAPVVGQTYEYGRFCTTVWKAANFLRARGVRERSVVAVADEPRAEPVLAVFASALLGARAYVGAPIDVEARALVAPAEDVGVYDLDAGAQRVGFGRAPDESGAYHFEGDVWSENPTMPPEAEDRSAIDVALVTGGRALTHGDLLETASDVASELSLTAETEVAVRGRLADSRVLAGGVLAPLLAGATVVFPDDDTVGDAAVVGPNTDAPESRTIHAADIED